MEKYSQLSREEKSRYWQNHFDCWKESNLSQKKYCKENSVSYWNFKSWYGKTNPDCKAKTKNFIKLKLGNINIGHSRKIEIMHNDKIKISVDENISEDNLRKLFAV